MFGETVEGWLSKTGLLGSTRHRRYCVLSGNELRYFKQKSDTRPTGTIDLKHYSIAEKDSGKQHPYGFRLVSQCRHHRSYIFYADHEQGCQYWVDMINATLDPFIGKHHTCHAPTLSPPPEENYSVLDKWLNRLDLNDQQHHQTSPTGPSPSVSLGTSLSGTHHSSSPTTTTKTMMTSTNTSNSTTIASSFSSYMSPSLRPYRTSTESLDSIPSDTTLSSSAGSRAQLSNAIFTPTPATNSKGSYHHHHHYHNHHHPSPYYHPANSSPTQFQTPTSNTTANNRRLSNPVALLSNFKQQYCLRSNQQLDSSDNNKNNKSPPAWSLDSMTASSLNSSASNNNNNNNSGSKMVMPSRKDWESDELFDFEDEMLYATHLSSARPPPLS